MKTWYYYFILVALTLPVLLLSSCAKDKEVIKEFYDNGQLKSEFQRKKKDFAKEGWFKAYDAEGRLLEEANYEDNKLHGKRQIFFEDGSAQIIEQYENGLFQGPYNSFHLNGALEMEGEYVDNKMEGDWKFYYANGQLKEIVRFTDNMENGPFTEYYENGKLKAVGSYLDGDDEHGELKLYDVEGELERVMQCARGVCHTEWFRGDTKQG